MKNNKLEISELVIFTLAISALIRTSLYALDIKVTDYLLLLVMASLALFVKIDLQKNSTLQLAWIGASTLVAVYTVDKGYDSWYYHLKGVLLLTEGWNPLKITNPEVWASSHMEHYQRGQDFYWVEVYPKASWYLAQELNRTIGNIEASKAINAYVALHVFQVWRTALSKERIKGLNYVALLITSSPIAISQFFTAYVDGLLGLAISGLIGSYLSLKSTGSKKFALLMGLYAILAINLKYTGAVYVIVLMILMARSIFSKGRAVSFFIIVAATIVSWNPYATNFLKYGDPLIGIHAKNVMADQMSDEFLEENRFAKAMYGYFYSNLDPYKVQDLRNVFENRGLTEIRKLITEQDLEIGGYGPLFGVILIMVLVAYTATRILVKPLRAPPENIDICIALLIITIVINPEFWWARYVPQMWIATVLMIIQLQKAEAFVGIVRISYGTLAATAATMAIGWPISTLVVTKRVQQQIEEIKLAPLYTPTDPVTFAFEPVAREILGENQGNLKIEEGKCVKYDRYFSHLRGCNFQNWQTE